MKAAEDNNKYINTIVRRAVRNDKKAFVELCELKAKHILFLCRRYMGNQHDAEDAAQEVFFQLQRGIKNLREIEAFNGWLNKLIVTTCGMMKRKNNKTENSLPIDDYDNLLQSDAIEEMPQVFVEDEEKRQWVIEIIDELPDKYRQCVLLHYYQRLSYAEIAEMMGITTAAVDNNLRMARKHMRLELEEMQTTAWSGLPMISIGSAISLICSETAETAVSASAIQALLQASGIGIASTLPAGTAAAGSAVAVGAGFGIKAVLQIVALSAAVLGGGAALTYTADQIINPPSPSSSVEEVSTFPQEEYFEPGDGDEVPVLTANVLSGRVYIKNVNTFDENARDGVAEYPLDLLNAETGEVIFSTKTGGDVNHGIYAFEGFEPGNYRMRIQLPKDAKAEVSAGYELIQSSDDSSVWYIAPSGEEWFTYASKELRSIPDIDVVLSYTATISGSVGADSTESDILSGITVTLADPQGRVVDKTSVDDSGIYTFSNPPVAQNGDYVLGFSWGSTKDIALPSDSVTLPLEPGKSVNVPHRILRDTVPPGILVSLHGGDCDCGHVNPDGVEIIVSDASTTSMAWRLEKGGTTVTSGSDTAQLNAAIDGLTDGSYVLIVNAEDAAGNANTIERILSIE